MKSLFSQKCAHCHNSVYTVTFEGNVNDNKLERLSYNGECLIHHCLNLGVWSGGGGAKRAELNICGYLAI